MDSSARGCPACGKTVSNGLWVDGQGFMHYHCLPDSLRQHYAPPTFSELTALKADNERLKARVAEVEESHAVMESLCSDSIAAMRSVQISSGLSDWQRQGLQSAIEAFFAFKKQYRAPAKFALWATRKEKPSSEPSPASDEQRQPEL